MLVLSPFFLILGLFLPGFFIARYLRTPLSWASGFPFSLLILFHCIFWLGIFHVPITLWTVLPCLVFASAGAVWPARKSMSPPESKVSSSWDRQDRLLLV